MDTGIYVGRRLSYEGHLCTVRYHGHLSGTTGQWLGVEWDDPSRGKHNGTHKGERIFRCLSSSQTAASFVRPTRKPDEERTVVEAIKFKYGSGSVAGTSDTDVVVISGKVAEEVGFDKIAKEQAQLADLRIVLIDQLVVYGIVPRGTAADQVQFAQQELSKLCPNIMELDLGWNTVENWSQVAQICAALPKLTTLKLGGLRFAVPATPPELAPMARVRELHLEECLLTPGDICDLLSASSGFPHLQELYLSSNQLSTLSLLEKRPLPCVPSLKSLVLENNLFSDLGCLGLITDLFSEVKSISLQANQISKVRKQSDPFEMNYPQIETLNISYNLIDSYAFLNNLQLILPNLSSLIITNNPLFKQDDLIAANNPRASDKSYYLTLARVPNLKTLNYARISARDREEGEMYYLSVAEKELKALFLGGGDNAELAEQAQKLHPQYQPLVAKYDRDSIIDRFLAPLEANDLRTAGISIPSGQVYPPGSLGARLVTATFYIPATNGSNSSTPKITLQLPSSLPVTRLMSILLRNPEFHAHLRPLQFSLIYESEELDPVDTTTESTTRSAVYGKKLTPEEKKSLWREWGDWDADAIVEDTLQRETAKENEARPQSVSTRSRADHWSDDGGFCIREGRKWKKREVEIPHTLKRPWGDWIEHAKEVRIRVVPFERQKLGT